MLAAASSKTLASQDTHTYELVLKEDQFVSGAVIQESVDVAITVNDPDGEEVGRFDNPARGPEHVEFNSSKAGTYELLVSPFEEDSGEYSLDTFVQEPLAETPQGKVAQMTSRYRDDMPGGVVAVVENGEIVFSRSYGLANVEYGIPNSVSTPYHMASVSKQFTGMAIVLLSQQGLLDVDDDVRKHVPDVPDFGHTITLRHLANHTSGLRDHWTLWTMSGGRMDDVIRQEDLMRLVHRQRELNFIPGDKSLYSNTGYLLLSEVVTAVADQPFGEWMQENVFGPLDMRETQIYDDHQRIVPGRAYSYRQGDDGLTKSVLSYANSGATSLFTTAEDLTKWLVNFRTGTVGGQEALDVLLEKTVLNDGEIDNYGLGIGVNEHNGLRLLSHGGADAGFRTWLGYYPELDAGVITLGNDSGFGTRGLGPRTAEAFFAEHMEFPEPEAEEEETDETAEEEQAEPWQPDIDALAEYEGRFYSDELETYYTVSIDDNVLTMQHIRHGEWPMTPNEEDSFNTNLWFVGTVDFERNGDGQISGLRMTNGRVHKLSFTRVADETL